MAGFHTLQDEAGRSVRLSDVGASLVSVQVPDRAGTPGEVILGLDAPDDYLDNPHYLGATVGRCAGRIRRGRFHLEGQDHQLPLNFGDHHLHGGPEGFSHRPWETAGPVEGPDGIPEITFTLHSPDGDQGYPGAVDVAVTYRLEPGGRLRILFRGRADAPTHLSLTNHAYFNLAGRGDVKEHRLRLGASQVLLLDHDAIPTGEAVAVTGGPMDFTWARPLFQELPAYDHCFVLDGWDGSLREAARVEEPETGRTLTVLTTFPGVQLYTPEFEEGTKGRGGDYLGREGFCLEAQFLPDSPNHPHFPPTRLDPGEMWEQETVYLFGVA